MGEDKTPKDNKPKPTPQEKVDAAVERLEKAIEDKVNGEGKSKEYQIAASIIKTAQKTWEEGKALDHKKIGDSLIDFARIDETKVSAKDYKKVITALLPKYVELAKAEEEADKKKSPSDEF